MCHRLAMAGLLLLVACPRAHSQYAYEDLEYWGQSRDTDGSGEFNVADIMYMVNYLFKSDSRPVPVPLAADVDCNGYLNIGDAINLVNALFRGHATQLCYAGLQYIDRSGDTEADRIAMLLSGELTAPELLKARVHSDLQHIRQQFGDVCPGTASVFFYVPWLIGDLSVRPDSATLRQIQDSTYTAWDSLNAAFYLESYELVGGTVYMRFDTEQNARAMARLYMELPGIVDAYPNHWLGDWPSLMPQQSGDTIKYLFRMAWGDCLAGCYLSQTWFLKALPDTTWFIGFWNQAGGFPLPAWWPEAFAVVQNYRRL